MTRIVLAGGGTAGHVNPLLATAVELTARGVDVRVLGTSSGLEADLVPAAGFDLVPIERAAFPRRPNAAALRFPGQWRRAVAQARAAVQDADAVVGFGGYVATPAYVAARRLRIPVVVHEQNAAPGLANRLGARLAAAVAVTFPDTPLPGAVVTGMPLRAQVLTAQDLDRAHAARDLGLDPERRTLLVSGGSLGAVSLNTVSAAVAADLLGDSGSDIQVLHLTGHGKSEAVLAALSVLPPQLRAHYHVREYLREMHLALAVADLVLGRAGAGAVSELTALGVPGVYVPLPVGNGEQRRNAQPVVTAGGGLLVADSDLTPEWMRANLVPLLHDADRLTTMATHAHALGIRDGAQRLADLVLASARSVR